MEHFIALVLSLVSAIVAATDGDRLRQVATNIWQRGHEAPFFCGEQNGEASALAMLAVAVHESGLQGSVQDCSICRRPGGWCPGGAVSLYQLVPGVAWGGFTRSEICSDNRVATLLASNVLTLHSGGHSTAHMYRGYASGDPLVFSRAAREIEAGFQRLLRHARIKVVYVDGCLTTRRIPLQAGKTCQPIPQKR